MSWMSIGLFKPPLPHLPRLEMPFLSPYQQKTNDWRRSNRRSILIQRIHFLTQGREDCFPQMGQVVDHVCITLRVLNNWMKVIKTAGSILFPSYTLVPNLPSALRPHGNTYFVLNSYLYFGQRIDLFLYPVLLSGSCYHGSWYSFTVLRIFSTILTHKKFIPYSDSKTLSQLHIKPWPHFLECVRNLHTQSALHPSHHYDIIGA